MTFPFCLGLTAAVYYAALCVGVWVSPHLGLNGRIAMTVVITLAVVVTAALFWPRRGAA